MCVDTHGMYVCEPNDSEKSDKHISATGKLFNMIWVKSVE